MTSIYVALYTWIKRLINEIRFVRKDSASDVQERYEGEKTEERELDLFVLQAEAEQSRCRNDSCTGALKETSREEMCAPNKLKVGISELCFKITLILYFNFSISSSPSHDKNNNLQSYRFC